ncbi:MAG TPA: inositol monophosphatase family protein [Gemmatimonadota bacterium]|nr:inositol monophosphatase family protein [Gemmatimonadota bacterium]
MRAADPADSAVALAVAREAAQAAAAVLRRSQAAADGRRGAAGSVAAKRRRDFVSDADRAAEEQIVERLRRAFPDHAIQAEESGETAGACPFRWIVDPLDGTTNFLHGFPVYSVSIALYEGDEPRVGLVVDPSRGEWFTARAGHGVRLDGGDPAEGRELRVTEEVDSDRRLIATGFPFRHPDEIDRYLAAFRALFERVGDMRRTGSAALDLAYIAAGRVDGFWEMGLNPWDIAAGELLVIEAGGRVSDWIGGGTHRETGWVAAGGSSVHRVLVDTLAEYA